MSDKKIIIKQSDPFLDVVKKCFNLIDVSWKALSLNIWTFLTITLIPLAILISLLTYAISLVATDEGKLDTSKITNSIDETSIALGIVAVIGLAILGVYLSIATLLTQLRGAKGKKTSFKEVINDAQDYFWQFLALLVISAFMIIAGLALFVLPGIIASLFLMFAALILVNEKVSATEAIKRSFKLVKNNWKIAISLIIVSGAVQVTTYVPLIGPAISAVLSIMYFCLPAVVYTRYLRNTK